ncbi:MAG: restriction endonuclease [Polyangiaceae bacterium]|nr:restriction endonuclease [Polyangiaceae bacterium]
MSSAESFPPQAAFFYAILRHLSAHPDGDQRTNIHEAMPELLGLSESQRRERLSNQPHLRYRWRSGWSLSVLKAAGYVDNPSRALWCVTEKGKKLLARNPGGFDDQVSRQIIRESRPFHGPGQVSAATSEGHDVVELTPDERIDAVVEELRNAVSAELLKQVMRQPPVFFENLVLELLRALGYGSSEDDLQRVGGSGDGGIDGIISLDRLGFEKVYV